MINRLVWDSKFFNQKIGQFKTDCLDVQSIDRLLKQKADLRYQVIYVFANKVNPDAEALLAKMQIQPVDNKLIFSRQITSSMKWPGGIEKYNGPLTKEIKDLAILSGHKSRFKKDPKLNPFYNELYTQWIKKSLTGELADEVLIADGLSNIKGFITLKHKANEGQIGLIAVNAQNHEKGIGTRLVRAALYWCFQQKLKTCTVVTQFDNTGACSLYKKNGFEIIESQKVFHL